MPKNKLFDEDSEEEVTLKTENEYAKKYDAWREKEELHKLEQKYGSKGVNSDISLSSDSEDESDEPIEVTPEVEKQFLKTLSLLKTKDPRIYDPNFKFFDEKLEKEKEKEPEIKKLTFGDSDDDEDDGANIFSIEKKAEIEKPYNEDKDSSGKSSQEDKLKDYLIGKVEHVDRDLESDLAPLRALWSDPKINDGEAFLRDYILNKRYLEDGDAGEAKDKIRDDDDLEEDEKMVEEQGKFERAYNFRFEEPDDEYLKRFPRTMNYIRPKDDRRSRKRAEIRTRKEEEKKQKMEEIARMKALKLKEIQEKIAKIKEVTGNQELAFKDEDIEGDFDPEEHDRRMKALFDEEYYGDVDEQKPVFPDLDDELEIENWEHFDDERVEKEYSRDDDGEDGPHCEDDNFNMDADYDPKRAKENLLEELKRNMGTKRRNRKKKSKLAQLLAEEKPKFVPDVDKKYSEFMEEYYKMDCEDVIGGDLPTRFKYREVVPNDFGLTIEEILLADDKELTQWVPLKKMVRYRPENVEKGEVKVYSQKSADINLKKKILPSLFKNLPEDPEIVVPLEEVKKKKKKKKKNKEKLNIEHEITQIDTSEKSESVKQKPKKKNKNMVPNDEENTEIPIKDNIKTSDNIENSYKKKKRSKNHVQELDNEIINDNNVTNEHTEKSNKKKKVKPNSSVENSTNKLDDTLNENTDNTEKKKKRKSDSTMENNISNNLENENVEASFSENLFQVKQSKDNKSRKDSLSTEDNIDDIQTKNNNKPKKKKYTNAFTVDTVSNEGPSRVNVNTVNSNKKRNKHKNAFEVDPFKGEEGNEDIKNNLKRKLEPVLSDNVPKKKRKTNKKKKENDTKSHNTKQNKLKNKNKTSNVNDKTNNPLSNLSDERLKAYGLNPKKYRSFLKYKKY